MEEEEEEDLEEDECTKEERKKIQDHFKKNDLCKATKAGFPKLDTRIFRAPLVKFCDTEFNDIFNGRPRAKPAGTYVFAPVYIITNHCSNYFPAVITAVYAVITALFQ